ncbi:MAG: hypothetical protein IV090_15930 [Candidatus Sericytochromatia bacterium]|nr:hypothetical protein [Candidatus Sericytochromatia bacterium]
MTSSLTLTDEALDRQQEVKQRQTHQQQNPYYQQDASGYVAPEGMYDQNQAYQAQSQTYHDPNQQYAADPNQGYYDPNYDPNQQYAADPNQGYYDPNYGSNQTYADPHSDYNPYDAPPPTTRPKRKPKTAEDYYRQMLGEGQLFATDSEESPYEETGQTFRPVHPGSNTPEHLIPRNSLLDLLGPIAKYVRLLLAKYKFLAQKLTYYTDMVLEIQEHVQKELKEAFGQAFKGLLDQLRHKSPVSLPYQHGQQPMAPGDPAYPPGQPPPPVQNYTPVSFVDLHELNVDFTDNYDQPLFDFSRYANSRYTVSKMIVDPQAMEMALYSIRECAPRASAIPPATEGPYANLPLSEVMMVIGETDLQAFLRYVKAYPGNYVARSLKISETFATWVVYGAPQP